MDGGQFDRIARRFARPTTRRAALGLAAGMGLGPLLTGARKKRKNPCRGGCPPCQICQKTGKRKQCAAAPDGSACAGGTCQAGACTCVPSTCASLNTVCGTVPDGCGATLACGTCDPVEFPACRDGICEDCAYACRSACQFCFHRPDGATVCGDNSSPACDISCASDADCPGHRPTCIASFTTRLTNETFAFASPALCGPGVIGLCLAVEPC